jgi:hypothetical protein
VYEIEIEAGGEQVETAETGATEIVLWKLAVGALAGVVVVLVALIIALIQRTGRIKKTLSEHVAASKIRKVSKAELKAECQPKRNKIKKQRSDGEVYFTDRGTNKWALYRAGASLPSGFESTAYVDIAVGGGSTTGYVYILRNDGEVYFTDRGTNTWTRYRASASLPDPTNANTSYVSIGAGRGTTSGYLYILRKDREVYFTDRGTNGWTLYRASGSPPPYSAAFVDIACGLPDELFALKNDGSIFKSTDGGTSWGTVWGNANDGVTSADVSWISIVCSESGYIFALRNDGKVVRRSISGGSWSAWGDADDGLPGDGTNWTSIAVDFDGYVYAMRNDGGVAYSTDGTTWYSKGDAGTGIDWVDITAFESGSSYYVYAMKNDRSIARCPQGTSTSWSNWATAGTDTSWVSVATDGTNVLTLRNDGRVDRAIIGVTPDWTGGTPFGDVGSDTSFVGIVIPISEYFTILIPVLLVMLIRFVVRRWIS